MKGSLFAVTGDNLGSHQIACLPENFSSAEYICRFCYIRNVEFQEDYKKRHQLRTQVSHLSDLERIEKNDGSSHGLKSDSILNTLNHFHTQGPGLPPCIAHDLFEGIINFYLSLILQNMISNKWFTINNLNATIKSVFKLFKIKDSNELILKKGGKINCKAAFCWNLVQVMPVVLMQLCCDKVESNIYQMFITLKEIVDLSTAQCISETQIACMKHTIFEYLDYRVLLFPAVKLRPKHHYLTHYPHLIKQFGPLIRFWTMRFESKHSYF